MKKIIIIGNSSYSVMLHKYITMTTDWLVMGFSAEEEYIQDDLLNGLKVYNLEILDTYDELRECYAVLAIGYKKMGTLRERLYNKVLDKGFRFVNYIHPTAIIANDARIGEANNILENVVICEGVIIGNANLFYTGSIVGHETKLGNYNTFSIGATTLGYVAIKNNCFLGGRSVIRDAISIGNQVLVGAGVYVDRNLTDESVFVPAKGIVLEGKRSIEFL